MLSLCVYISGANAEGRRVRAERAVVRVHRHRQLGPGHAAARPQRQAVLRRQDAVHLRLGQTQALYAIGENVLRQRTRHRRFPQQTHQSHLEAIQEEAVAQECRS